jgi:Tfp pilus assembly protein PilF
MSNRSTLALAALFLLPVSALAQNGMIRGKVRDQSGTTVNNAIVELRSAVGVVTSQIVTRNDGDFLFSGLRGGEYEVSVTLSGYEPVTQVVQLRDSMMINSREASGVVSELVNVEIRIHRRAGPSSGSPTTTFAQEVPPVAREAYAKGMAKVQEGKFEEGMVFLRDAIANFNDYFDAHFALGFELYRLGKDNEAIEELERARLINDRGAAVYYVFGLVMVRQQKFNAAEYAFGKAVELSVNHVASRFNHGVALIEVALRAKETERGRTALARADEELSRAFELSDKRLTAVFLQRARIHEERGDKEAAAREIENYLKAEPNSKDTEALKETIRKLREKK